MEHKCVVAEQRPTPRRQSSTPKRQNQHSEPIVREPHLGVIPTCLGVLLHPRAQQTAMLGVILTRLGVTIFWPHETSSFHTLKCLATNAQASGTNAQVLPSLEPKETNKNQCLGATHIRPSVGIRATI
ncbi:hypothetical protein PIB30_036786 [Stylosanthes scabra]|uniref:Uncharacterized protein n=1 Tax=Stylosanthes scabra TaxID=79078 RepID=A0ABU6XB84_9FABA|nr:hypothetical protein [Stylosanthes scabra]